MPRSVKLRTRLVCPKVALLKSPANIWRTRARDGRGDFFIASSRHVSLRSWPNRQGNYPCRYAHYDLIVRRISHGELQKKWNGETIAWFGDICPTSGVSPEAAEAIFVRKARRVSRRFALPIQFGGISFQMRRHHASEREAYTEKINFHPRRAPNDDPISVHWAPFRGPVFVFFSSSSVSCNL